MHLLSTGYSACSSSVFNGEMYKIGYGVPARDAWAAFETVRREDPGNAWADCFALADRASSAHYPGSAGRLRVDDRERKVGSSRNRSRDYFRRERRLRSLTPVMYEMPWERSINVDGPGDLLIVRALIESGLIKTELAR